MACKITSLEAATTIGINIGKNTFHLIGLDKKGAIVLRQKLSRRQVDSRLANSPCPLCPRSDYWRPSGLINRANRAHFSERTDRCR